MEIFFLKIVKIAFINENYKLSFSWRCSKCPKNKIVHNFLITNPNGMIQTLVEKSMSKLTKKCWFGHLHFCWLGHADLDIVQQVFVDLDKIQQKLVKNLLIWTKFQLKPVDFDNNFNKYLLIF